MTAADWDRYWQGRGQGGEAFLGEGVERHPTLEAFWQERFGQGPDGPVLDLAAGAGSVAKIAAEAGRPTFASDISKAAMDVLTEAVPGIACTAASADALPYEDATFALVASQFGIEYAPDEAFAEAARILAPGGRAILLVHYKGGAIDNEVRTRREQVEAALQSGLFDAATNLARGLFRGSFAEEKAAYDKAEAAALATGAQLTLYTVQGFRRMASRHQAYDEGDILGWVGGMRAEAEAFLGRMTAMEAAARDEAEIRAIADRLAAQGLEEVSFQPFSLREGDAPAAWHLEGRKPA